MGLTKKQQKIDDVINAFEEKVLQLFESKKTYALKIEDYKLLREIQIRNNFATHVKRIIAEDIIHALQTTEDKEVIIKFITLKYLNNEENPKPF